MKSNRQKQRFCHPKMADLKAWSHGVRKANCSCLEFRHLSDFHSRLRHIFHLENVFIPPPALQSIKTFSKYLIDLKIANALFNSFSPGI